jgi:hypothetical protein
MSLKTISFFDGFTSSTNPDITQVDVNSVVIFADDSGYEAEYTATAGSLYYNTTLDVLRYYDGTIWQTVTKDADLNSHTADSTIHFTESSINHNNITNVGSNTHGEIDSHIVDSTIHFTESSINHANITGIGTNSHSTIDSHIASSTAHGVSGSVVGTTDSQVISGKNFSDALLVDEISTPANPASGKLKIYPKSGKLYILSSAGVESELAASTSYYGFANTTGAANGNITNATITTVKFNNVVSDTGSMLTTTTGVLTMPKAGELSISSTVTWAGSGWNLGEFSLIIIRINNTELKRKINSVFTSDASATNINLSNETSVIGYPVSQGDTCEVRVYQNTGAALPLEASTLYNVVSWSLV